MIPLLIGLVLGLVAPGIAAADAKTATGRKIVSWSTGTDSDAVAPAPVKLMHPHALIGWIP